MDDAERYSHSDIGEEKVQECAKLNYPMDRLRWLIADGYRAGQSALLERLMKEGQEFDGDMDSDSQFTSGRHYEHTKLVPVIAALREENQKFKKFADFLNDDSELEELRAENERLQSVVTKQKEYVGEAAQKIADTLEENASLKDEYGNLCKFTTDYEYQIAAEKARAAKLVETLKLIAGPSEFNCEIGESNQRSAAEKALAEYNAESGK